MLAIRHIFEYLNNVLNTIWNDFDSALVKIENLEHWRIRRIVGDIFNIFKLYYNFNVVCLTVNRVREKGIVEQDVLIKKVTLFPINFNKI